MRPVSVFGAIVIAFGLAAATPGPPAAAPAAGAPAARARSLAPAPALARSVRGAYRFLSQMMDRYATGSTTRLVQSFSGGVLGRQHFTDSYSYDDAVLIDAYLAEGSRAGLSRAVVIGNALLFVQAHDPAGDGRIRAAYAPVPLLRATDVRATDKTSDVGAMAWAGQALARLYAATGKRRYLAGAEAIGRWIQASCRDSRGPGGYAGGFTAGGMKSGWKSTEQNIDAYAMFRTLAALTGDPAWPARAAWAKGFVTAMWDRAHGRFYAGTTADGKTPNDAERPGDVNAWSYLAVRSPAYAAAVGWNVRNLAVTAGGFTGVSFCQGDRTGVWFEGTAHLADALRFRDGRGDAARAAGYLAGIAYAQAHGPNNDGLGVVAASRNRLSDCGGGYYFASLHTGATAWYILAAAKTDPFLP